MEIEKLKIDDYLELCRIVKRKFDNEYVNFFARVKNKISFEEIRISNIIMVESTNLTPKLRIASNFDDSISAECYINNDVLYSLLVR